ncbi:hypothetical protein [Anaerovibrio sp.]|nr:hypothetical protein [Anaerovibrio sp.]
MEDFSSKEEKFEQWRYNKGNRYLACIFMLWQKFPMTFLLSN